MYLMFLICYLFFKVSTTASLVVRVMFNVPNFFRHVLRDVLSEGATGVLKSSSAKKKYIHI